MNRSGTGPGHSFGELQEGVGKTLAGGNGEHTGRGEKSLPSLSEL